MANKEDPERKHPKGILSQEILSLLFNECRPGLEDLIHKALAAGNKRQVLVVGYKEAGRLIGTSYEGIRKLVKRGELTAVRRSGRLRGIEYAELQRYIERNRLSPKRSLSEQR